MLFLTAAALVLLDQTVKFAVRAKLDLGETFPVVPNIFHLTYVQNRGTAFSMFSNRPVMTIAIPAAVIIICIYLMFYMRKEVVGGKLNTAALLLIVSGGISNLVDRLTQGFVTDMFDFRVFSVFNVADIYITCGCAMLIIYLLFIDGKK